MRKKNQSNKEWSFDLESKHGPLIGGVELSKALGFRTQAAFRQALHRGRIQIKLITLPGRRGKYALTHEVEEWLMSLKQSREEVES